jgi:hypothetical protein
MRSTAGRVAVLCAFVAVAAVLFVALRGGDDEGDGSQPASTAASTTSAPTGQPASPSQPPTEMIRMRDGAPVGGVEELTYTKGEQVRIKLKLDETQEDVHIHGYEIEKLDPSGTVIFAFPAKIEGIFELEAHGPSGDVLLAEITVEPA